MQGAGPHSERIKLVLYFSNVDHGLLELQFSWEEPYQSFPRTIESINAIFSTYFDKALGDVQIYPDGGSIAFSSVSPAGTLLSTSLPLTTPGSSVLTARRCSSVRGATATFSPNDQKIDQKRRG